ncbi:hypothetical protein [Novosphingobium sp. EMRT-2]|uniref:hypothetical protein n=1 Tax=Novosphingobium sp. EMRT-2 TaxID=2571749 RepID=UPI0010BD8396|nr:hypothetical protein [Novosphingobium sp. EMRT-2]QCI92707.1 hypothetical protein FA702_03495 [Novosphingobium sp. EMRT-2]
MRRLLISLVACQALAACAPAKAPTAPSAPVAQSGPSCAASGGFLERRGRLGAELCVHRYADAGKACHDKADCQGRCIADREGGLPAAGEPASGKCQADDRLFGCFAEVRDGKAQPGLCID